MKVSVSKSKNTTIYYLSKSVRIDGKVTTKTIEKIGSYDEIKKICGDMDPLEWAKKYAAKRSAEEKASRQDIIIKYSSSSRIKKGVRRSVNIGYLFLKDIYYDLGIDRICSEIAEKYKFEYDLNDILSMLVFSRIIYPGSKRSSLELSQMFLEKPACELHQVYRALEILAKENDSFQSELYKNSEKVMDRQKGVLYYDCTNYYFEIEEEDDFRKYGHSKEHRPNPVVQMGLFMDAEGIPLTFSVFNGNENEQPSMRPLEKKILSDFGIKKCIVCTDAGLSSTPNRIFNDTPNRRFVTTQPIKKLKGFLKDFCLDEEGWHLSGSRETFRLSELDAKDHYETIFYKDRWIKEDGLEQHLIVTFSFKYRDYMRKIRGRQLERAAKLADHPSSLKRSRPNHTVREEERYDGFYAVCTNLEDDVSAIISINQKRWQIEECFRIMKSEFQARPVYLSRKDRITAHFITCFTALILYRILEKKIGEGYTCENIIRTLKEMNMLVIPGDGYIPEYTRTDLTDQLHAAFGFRTDYEIVSQRNMKKILTATRK